MQGTDSRAANGDMNTDVIVSATMRSTMPTPRPRYSAAALLRARFSGQFWKPLWRQAQPQAHYDVLIVGAGGHGLSTAYNLARYHGIKRIAIVEKSILGYGNVARNTTIVRSNYLLPENHYFYEDSLRRYEGLSRELNYNVMYS